MLTLWCRCVEPKQADTVIMVEMYVNHAGHSLEGRFQWILVFLGSAERHFNLLIFRCVRRHSYPNFKCVKRCDVNIENRKKCRACRWNRCLAAGTTGCPKKWCNVVFNIWNIDHFIGALDTILSFNLFMFQRSSRTDSRFKHFNKLEFCLFWFCCLIKSENEKYNDLIQC